MANRKAQDSQNRIFAGLDIGSSKVCFIIGQEKPSGIIDVIGLGQAPNSGIRKGVVVNIEATTKAILTAKEEAELMAGYQVDSIFMSVGGAHIESFDSKGMVAVTGEEVTPQDIERVIMAAKAVAVPSEREVLHIIPKDFKIDDQEGISDPVGMSGVRLEASVHIVTGGTTAIQNALKCAEKAKLKVKSLVLEQLASSLAVMNEDEKSLGVAVVDIGAGTSDLILYAQGNVSYTHSIPVGGKHITGDIAVGMRTTQSAAEIIKKKYACALSSLVSSTESIDVPTVNGGSGRSILRRHLCEVVEPRAEEILNFILNDIQASQVADLLGAGVIFTGGTSQLDGFIEMAEFLFDMPVRKGVALEIGGLKDIVKAPNFTTAVGLLKYAQKENSPTAVKTEEEKNMLSGFTRKIREFFGDIN